MRNFHEAATSPTPGHDLFLSIFFFFWLPSSCYSMQHSEKRKSFPENSLIIIASFFVRGKEVKAWGFFARWAS